MRTRAIAWLLVLLLVLAGCLGTDVPAGGKPEPATAGDPEVHEVAEVRAFEAVAGDGVALRGHVYLPTGQGPFATVLEFSPYLNTLHYPTEDAGTTDENGRRTMKWWNGPLLEAGFAVALVNIRGTGESDGCFLLGNPQDAEDAASVVRGLAAQPWSNGRVGMHGFSYPGFVTYAALTQAPPELQAAIPVAGGYDQWMYHTRQGAAISDAVFVPPLWTAGAGLGAFAATSPAPFVPDTSPEHACPAILPGWLASAEAAWDGDANGWYEARDLRDALAGAHLPILAAQGFDDWTFSPFADHLWTYAGGEKRMWLGQFIHTHPMWTDRGEAFMDLAIAFLDHHLRDGPPLPAELAPVHYQAEDGAWHEAERWPPVHQATRLYLSDGALVLDPSAVRSSEQTFQSTDATPCPRTCPPVRGVGSAPACLATQALYVSEPLGAPVHLAGRFTVNLTLSSTLPDGNLGAVLYHTPGDGTCPDEEAVEIEQALTDLRHADGARQGTDFRTGTPGTLTAESHPFAITLPQGHRLVLAIGGGSARLLPDAHDPLLTVHTSPELAGDLTVPVVAGTLRFGSRP